MFGVNSSCYPSLQKEICHRCRGVQVGPVMIARVLLVGEGFLKFENK